MKKLRIILEPKLELQASCLNACQCRQLARVYDRWAHQLKMKAAILDVDAAPPPRRVLRRLPTQKLLLN